MIHRRPAKGGWQRQAGVFALGAITVYMGAMLPKRGIFVVHNGYQMETYSAALAATGFLLMLLVLIPDSLVSGFLKRHDN